MKVQFGLFFFILLSLISCTDNSFSNQVGIWEVTEDRKNYLNDSLSFEHTNNLTLEIQKDGSGSIIRDGSQTIPIHWVGDSNDNTIIIIQEFDNNNTSSSKFSIVSDNKDTQQWIEEKVLKDLFSNNEMKYVLTWNLVFME